MSELGDEKAILEEQFKAACDRAEEWKAKYNAATARADTMSTEARLANAELARARVDLECLRSQVKAMRDDVISHVQSVARSILGHW